MSVTLRPGRRELLRRLPKIELHRHLPGSLRLETILELAAEYGLELPTRDPEQLRRYVQVLPGTPADLGHILRTVSVFSRRCFVSPEAVERVAFEMAEDAWRDGVVYLEARFSPEGMALGNPISSDEVVEAAAAGLARAGARYGIRTGILIGLTREAEMASVERAAGLARAYVGRGVVGVDLSGDEAGYPPELFAGVFERLRVDGRLGITIHAGEARGPESVRAAIELLAAQRIGHGVRVVRDPAVVELARARGVALEACPTSSNVLTGAVQSLDQHPLPSLLRDGLMVTINTDDPGWFGATLTDEYETALDRLGLSFGELTSAALNAARAAFLPPDERDVLACRLSSVYAEAAPALAEPGRDL